MHVDNVLDIPWAISIDAADDGYTPIVADAELMALDFGLFDDSFMHEGHEIKQGDGYNERCWRSIGEDKRWKVGVCGGEVSSRSLVHGNPRPVSYVRRTARQGVEQRRLAAIRVSC